LYALEPEADLTVGHSCSGRRGPWPWRPPGGPPGEQWKLVALQRSPRPPSWIKGVLLLRGREGKRGGKRRGREGQGRGGREGKRRKGRGWRGVMGGRGGGPSGDVADQAFCLKSARPPEVNSWLPPVGECCKLVQWGLEPQMPGVLMMFEHYLKLRCQIKFCEQLLLLLSYVIFYCPTWSTQKFGAMAPVH